MSLTAPKNTLAYQLKARPATMQRDLSGVLMKDAMAQLNAFMAADGNSETAPEQDALWFYMLNHAVACVRQRFDTLEPLSEPHLEVLEKYHGALGPKIARMAYYLLLICARENRHLGSKETVLPAITKLYGAEAAEFMKKVPDHAESAVQLLCQSPPACTLGQYVGALSYAFYNGSWGSSYGGPKWGNIADTLLKMIKGEWTAEMMMDTAFTLAHNTAPIFNKGMLYAHNGHQLIRILDVQRSGQIPAMITGNDKAASNYATTDLVALTNKLAHLLGEPFVGKGYVDWYRVEALGAVGHYEQEKKAQAAVHGIPSDIAEKQKMQAAKEQLKADAEFNSTFEVMPGVKVKKFKMARA